MSSDDEKILQESHWVYHSKPIDNLRRDVSAALITLAGQGIRFTEFVDSTSLNVITLVLVLVIFFDARKNCISLRDSHNSGKDKINHSLSNQI